MPRVTNHS